MTKTLKPGQKALRSGEYQIHGSRGRAGGGAMRGESPPTLPKGETLVTKSGRIIIVSPARSASTTVSTWSNAFKK
jgi:hypothetical protein